jgi:hypothetical protein
VDVPLAKRVEARSSTVAAAWGRFSSLRTCFSESSRHQRAAALQVHISGRNADSAEEKRAPAIEPSGRPLPLLRRRPANQKDPLMFIHVH